MQSLDSLLIRLKFLSAQGRLTNPSLEDMVNVSTEGCSPKSRTQFVNEIMKATREFTSVLGEYESKTMTEEQLRGEVKRIDDNLSTYLWSWFLEGGFRPQKQSDVSGAILKPSRSRKVIRRVRKVKISRPRLPPLVLVQGDEWFPPAFGCPGIRGSGCRGISCELNARDVRD